MQSAWHLLGVVQDCNQRGEAGLDAGEAPCKLSAMPSICTQGMSGFHTEKLQSHIEGGELADNC